MFAPRFYLWVNVTNHSSPYGLADSAAIVDDVSFVSASI